MSKVSIDHRLFYVPTYDAIAALNLKFGGSGWSFLIDKLEVEDFKGEAFAFCRARLTFKDQEERDNALTRSTIAFLPITPNNPLPSVVMECEHLALKRLAFQCGLIDLEEYAEPDPSVSCPTFIDSPFIPFLYTGPGPDPSPFLLQGSATPSFDNSPVPPPTPPVVAHHEPRDNSPVPPTSMDTKPLTPRQEKRKKEKEKHIDPSRPIHLLHAWLKEIGVDERGAKIINAFICEQTKAQTPTTASDAWVARLLDKIQKIGDIDKINERIASIEANLNPSLIPPSEAEQDSAEAKDKCASLYIALQYIKTELELERDPDHLSQAHDAARLISNTLNALNTNHKRLQHAEPPERVEAIFETLSDLSVTLLGLGARASEVTERCLSGDLVPF